ncbi:kinase-like domain-containing protein [Mycena amicta]|nr:kinase-like domain-containing protein [Mycena amicta]
MQMLVWSSAPVPPHFLPPPTILILFTHPLFLALPTTTPKTYSPIMSPASHTLPNLTGSLIDDGSLELIALLGCGAYGKVYKAQDLAAGPDETTFYAVKCMWRYAPGSRAHSIQQDELLIHQMVSDHPRIITFYRHFTTEEYVFVVLEFAQSDFFSAVVDREIFRHRPALIKEAFNEVLDAVDFLHHNGIYHRDIKPDNILCDQNGTNLRFADFGLSTQRQLSTQFGCGSRFYMSPESIDPMTAEGCYSARYSDMWAISVLFTNLISGHMPWTSADMSDPAYAFFRENDDYLRRALNLTPETNALLTRCFAENPRRRPTIEQFRVAVNGMERFALDDQVENTDTDKNRRRRAHTSPSSCPSPSTLSPTRSSLISWNARSRKRRRTPLSSVLTLPPSTQTSPRLHLPPTQTTPFCSPHSRASLTPACPPRLPPRQYGTSQAQLRFYAPHHRCTDTPMLHRPNALPLDHCRPFRRQYPGNPSLIHGIRCRQRRCLSRPSSRIISTGTTRSTPNPVRYRPVRTSGPWSITSSIHIRYRPARNPSPSVATNVL